MERKLPARSRTVVYPRTPDRRYFVVRGYLWRLSNPDLPEDVRAHWVRELMSARRAIRGAAKACDPVKADRAARQRVARAKGALGERGPPWWGDGAPDYNRRRVEASPYAAWFASLAERSDTAVSNRRWRPGRAIT